MGSFTNVVSKLEYVKNILLKEFYKIPSSSGYMKSQTYSCHIIMSAVTRRLLQNHSEERSIGNSLGNKLVKLRSCQQLVGNLRFVCQIDKLVKSP